jgi:heme/copper-type cytochrome/quinol oxidase subunit 2
MLTHYLKIAFRNLRKYRLQTVISVAGLAVGFVCFALATLWIRYEMTYDGFHKDADRMYLVRHKRVFDFNASGISSRTPYPLAAYLKETFPEVDAVCLVETVIKTDVETEGLTRIMSVRQVDTMFLNMFRVRLIAGSLDFTVPKSKNVAITEEQAAAFFGSESPLGKQIKINAGNTYTVCAVVGGWGHSNYSFDLLAPIDPYPEWGLDNWETLVRLKTGTDVEAFAEKLHSHKIERDNRTLADMLLTPVTAVRYNKNEREVEVAFRYIVLFAVAGGLVIICSLFNTLILFSMRFRIRERELALRTVFGAGSRSLFVMLSMEYLLMLFVAFLLGMLCVDTVLEPFKKMSETDTPTSAIFVELLAYAAVIALVSLGFFLLLMFVFRRKATNASIRNSGGNISRKISVTLQLIISIIFIFCTTVMVKQIRFLRTTDLGFEFRNTARLWLYPVSDIKALEHRIKQLPEIADMLMGSFSLMPKHGVFSVAPISEWDDMPPDAKPVYYEIMAISKQFMDFYHLRLTEGEFAEEGDTGYDVWINETLAKQLGWNKSTGKKLNHLGDMVTVKGVFKDIHSMAPTVPVQPLVFQQKLRVFAEDKISRNIVIKYQSGQWKTCKSKIEQLAREEYPNARLALINAEDAFEEYTKSETMLITLLMCVSSVCIIISVFGLFSLVALSCERRQKEIAIRKINGATVKDILDMYFKEYMLLLFVGATVAFPVSYLMMKTWLQQYVKQTAISAWIYAAILLLLAMIIVMCIGWRVFRAAKSNPAEVIKK